MAIHVLVPGADGRAWYWHRLVPELRARGHETVTMDLPDEDSAGLAEFADAICEAVQVTVGERAGQQRLVVVAQSLGGFSAPLVCGRLPVDELVLVNAMVPVSGESAGQWWENTGQPQARAAYAAASGRDPDAPFDVRADFFHDVPRELTEQAFAAQPPPPPPSALFAEPWPLPRWPEVPTRFLQGREDRFFPLEFQRRVVRERLGLDLEELPGGHLVALSRPRELAELLLST
ncbi:alpha/beta hydrolase [Kitasatospora sp. GAS204B]|uniref:alpha/beta fold hydrolase n=1 Tax=unclassified Kitasatospora TaxID=2633591 RepID=UPI002473EA23|nr:alpha/beta hydrolase [Kitasatospora sp. GAS204B]MDH6122258.1 pimeloyl-ACP methyl ester carboxylesterase [Kitasatospora sp. GAS204B]